MKAEPRYRILKLLSSSGGKGILCDIIEQAGRRSPKGKLRGLSEREDKPLFFFSFRHTKGIQYKQTKSEDCEPSRSCLAVYVCTDHHSSSSSSSRSTVSLALTD